MSRFGSESGFSMVELLVATGIFLIVSAVVTSALMQMTNSQTTIWNRTEMHSGVRGATELLQQEVGQAGRIALPAPVTLPNGVSASASCDWANPSANAVNATVSSAVGVFQNMLLTTFDGDLSETVKVASVNPSTSSISACFTKTHANGTSIMPLGGFATGIIPDSGMTNGSTGTVLKLYGDINGDGSMVYVEYTCDLTAHKLYRNVMSFNSGSKPVVTDSQILLANIVPNPGGTNCFTYQTTPTITVDGTPYRFVLDVAITLTVQTQQIDPITRAYQTETKALLNVSPRNVFNTWALAGIGYTNRIQPTPASVLALLPPIS